MRISRTERFKKSWDKLNGEEKALARKAMVRLVTNMHYPSLRVKKIQGTRDIWEARASRSWRITFQLIADEIVLRNIGKHDETLENP